MFMIKNDSGGVYYYFDYFLNDDVEDTNDDSKAYCRYDSVYPADPKKQFVDAFGYCKLNADRVDWVLENVLCVKPDRTKCDDDFDKTKADYYGNFNYYYYDGYYYYQFDEGGGGWGPMSITDCSRQPDGSYLVRMTTIGKEEYVEYDLESHGHHDFDTFEVSAELKEVDGHKVWAVSYVKWLEKHTISK